MPVVNPVELIKGAWLGVAPAGYSDNVHALVQGEIVDPDGRRLVTYPALVFSSVGVATIERSPDGRRGLQVEQFQLDFRADSYEQARDLSYAFRQETLQETVEWTRLADDFGLDLVLRGGGEIVPRRVVSMTVPYRDEFG